MNTYINFNGQYLPSGKPVISANYRGFRYGEGIFETMKVREARIILSGYHFDRFLSGLRLLEFDLPGHFTAEFLSEQVIGLCQKNKHEESARVRLVAFRGEGSLQGPLDQVPHYIIQSWSQDLVLDETSAQAVGLGLFPDGRKAVDRFSNLKSNNYLLYAMAAAYATKQGWTDCIVLNSHERVCETSIANIFCAKDGIWYTPALAEGCVAGVVRRYLLEKMPAADYQVREEKMERGFLEQADEIFLCNSMVGIRPVDRLGNRQYGHSQFAILQRAFIDQFF